MKRYEVILWNGGEIELIESFDKFSHASTFFAAHSTLVENGDFDQITLHDNVRTSKRIRASFSCFDLFDPETTDRILHR